MLTADYLDVLPDSIIELYESFQQSVVNDIVRRLIRLGSPTATAAWSVQRLSEAGFLYEDIIKKISDLTDMSETELRRLFNEAGVKSMTFDDSIYIKAGMKPLPLNQSPAMLDVMRAGLERTAGTLRNITLTTAITGQTAFIKAADLAYMQVATGAFSYSATIKQAIKDISSKGITVIDYASGRQDQLDVAVRRTVLTGINQTAGRLTEKRADEMGTDLVQTSAHLGARNKGNVPENHELWQGKIFSRSGTHPKYPDFYKITGYGTVTGLLGINCVLGNTKVSGPRISAAYRREYSGEFIIIQTAGGHELTITPNHKILTKNGWVAAGSLAEGDNIFCCSDFKGILDSSPHIDQGDPTIQEVFDTLTINKPLISFPVSSSDFHGDVSINHKVDIIFPDSFLRDGRQSPINQKGIKVFFSFPDHLPDTLLALCSPDKIGFGTLHSSDGVMGWFCQSNDFITGHSVNAVTHSVCSVVRDRNAELREIFSNRAFGNAGYFRDFVFPHTRFIHSHQVNGFDPVITPDIGLPISASVDSVALEAIDNGADRTVMFICNVGENVSSVVHLDNIVNIERKSSKSSFVHVYNLETNGGWYFANGIISHNCRHSWYPFFEGISKNAYKEADLNSYANKTVTYNGKEISFYEATQKQRAIERKIREWKRRASALEAGGFDNSEAIGKVRQWQGAMRDFVSQTELVRQSAREQI